MPSNNDVVVWAKVVSVTGNVSWWHNGAAQGQLAVGQIVHPGDFIYANDCEVLLQTLTGQYFGLSGQVAEALQFNPYGFTSTDQIQMPPFVPFDPNQNDMDFTTVVGETYQFNSS